MTRVFKNIITAVALIGCAGTAFAQGRSPEYAAARAAGQVGEQPDGYLGVIGEASATARALVASINIQRKAAYTRQSVATGATVEQFAFTSGCNLIEKTVPGEKYRAPLGGWQTRTSAPPLRDSRCI